MTAAAESDPEGGCWLYHFDNPADDADSVEVPKVGYARLFAGQIPLPDTSTIPTELIVNSGFCLSDDSEFVMDILEALKRGGQSSILFGITAPGDGDGVAGDDLPFWSTARPPTRCTSPTAWPVCRKKVSPMPALRPAGKASPRLRGAPGPTG